MVFNVEHSLHELLLNGFEHKGFHAAEALQPQVVDSRCVWRQTGRCSPDGPREPEHDLPCNATVDHRRSGYCQCAGGEIVGRRRCNHPSAPSTCEEACASPASHLRPPERPRSGAQLRVARLQAHSGRARALGRGHALHPQLPRVPAYIPSSRAGHLPDVWLNTSEAGLVASGDAEQQAGEEYQQNQPTPLPLRMLYNRQASPTPHDLLVYLHIPKCAGSSFLNNLEDVSSSFNLHWLPSYSPSRLVLRNSFQVPGCHRPGAMHCSYSEIATCLRAGHALTTWNPQGLGRPKFVVMLRDPVKRLISEFFWGRSNWCLSLEKSQAWSPGLCQIANAGSLKNHRQLDFKEEELLEWIHSPFNLGLNRQVKHLVAAARAPILVDAQECVNTDYGRYTHLWGNRYPPSDDFGGTEEQINADLNLVQIALHTLETKFLFVGIRERFMHSVNCFRNVFLRNSSLGPDHLLYGHSARRSGRLYKRLSLHQQHRGDAGSEHASRAPHRAISERVLQEMREHNLLDVALYEAIEQKFELACAATSRPGSGGR
mmetsp:Transcript_11139/g.21221  ORF Transcript_11139/g.21221 Transcript_11139/m.21221 type:complete len:543 (+) Transcript_11139:69-1697(+)